MAIALLAPSPVPMRSVADVLTRATEHPALLAALAANPLQALLDAGATLTATDLKRLLDIPDATDHELLDVVIARLARETKANCGCGS